MNNAAPQLIGVDWGTTSLRCYLITAQGGILDRKSSADGIMNVANGRFGDVLAAMVGGWIAEHGDLPITMSGMIGSRQGWCEAPYVHCPAGLDDLWSSRVTLHHPGLPQISLIAGVDTRHDEAIPDVMRGEETQIFGALTQLATDQAVFVLPGTHAKWVIVRDGTITDFRTYMTGEVFSALKDHTILGRLITGATHCDAAFRQGVAASAGDMPGDLLSTIFSARSLALFDRLPGGAVESYLSGLLIGAEIASAARWTGGTAELPLHILAGSILAERYGTACDCLQISYTVVHEECVVLGHRALAGLAEAHASD